MIELKNNQRVPLEIGGSCTVKRELGRGGQGIVYLVDLNGKEMALKWYSTYMKDEFYENLEKNIINKRPPSEAFLWPLYLTRKIDGHFGYLMHLRPEGYYDFGQFIMAKRQFKDFYAMLNAAMKICIGFDKLHLAGCSYQDLNDGNFFIRPEDGDLLICDNDNVSPQGTNSGIKGKMRYMAPEIVLGTKKPDKYSDRFSLSVVLFLLFYLNHPFEGFKVVLCPCISEKYERKFFGEEIEFIYSPKRGNRPVKDWHPNVWVRWPLFPKKLKDVFSEQFSEDVLRNPESRILDIGWQNVITSVRDETVVCPSCGKVTFLDVANNKCDCLFCDNRIDISQKIHLNNRDIYLTPKSLVYINDKLKADGLVGVSAKDQKTLTLVNIGKEIWSVELPSGKTVIVAPKETMPIRNGFKVSFGSTKAEIITNN
jgi:serine/threonine protein kinase